MQVKDINLSEGGEEKVRWAEMHMPVLYNLREKFEKERPLSGTRITCCLHITKETALLVLTLKAGGAKISLCPSNPLSTQDDVAAFLASQGIEVFGWKGLSQEDYYMCMNSALKLEPEVILDDGADLITRLHLEKRKLSHIKGGCEETTTGVIRLKALESEGKLRFPVIAVNNASSKMLFDNYYGTGESSLHGILRSTNILLPGKNFVICGYGNCGKGVAKFARNMGAHTIICEVDPIKALKAFYDGHSVMPISEASKIGDIFLTVTGCKNVITEEHFKKMKNGAVLCNAGHFNVEIDVEALRKCSKGKKVKPGVEEFFLDEKKLYLLGEGRLVNLACAEGHPSEVMDLSFSLQALSVNYLKNNELDKKVHPVPEEIDKKVSIYKLEAHGIKIDTLSEEQKKYLLGWREGT